MKLALHDLMVLLYAYNICLFEKQQKSFLKTTKKHRWYFFFFFEKRNFIFTQKTSSLKNDETGVDHNPQKFPDFLWNQLNFQYPPPYLVYTKKRE